MSLFSDTQTCLFFFWLCGHSSVVFFVVVVVYFAHFIHILFTLRCHGVMTVVGLISQSLSKSDTER